MRRRRRTWRGSFASLCHREKLPDHSPAIPVTVELASINQTATFTSDVHSSKSCFLNVSASSNVPTEEASDNQMLSKLLSQGLQVCRPGDSTRTSVLYQ